MKFSKNILLLSIILTLVCGMAYAQPPCQPNFDLYVGWQGGQKQTLTTGTDRGAPGALYRFSQMEVPNRGVWLGAGASATWGCDLAFYLQGWYFLPTETNGTILLDPGGVGGLRIPAGLSTNVEWWYVDGFGTVRVSGPFSAVLGVRLDHHNYSSKDPEILNLIIPVVNQMRFDLDVCSTIPFFGVQLGPASGITVRALYSPWGRVYAKSSLSQNNDGARDPNWLGGHGNLTRRDFIELFGEYTGQVTPSFQLGVFGRGTWLNGTTQATLTETIAGGSSEYSVSYRSVSWTIGGKASLALDFQGWIPGW